MALDLQAMLKDKRLLLGMGGAAALGAFVLYRRKAATGTTSTTGAASGGTTYAGTGQLDTTGTDVASWLGNYSASLAGQNAEQRQLIADQLKAFGDTLAGSTSAAQTLSNFAPVREGTSLTDVAARQGLTVDQLKALNGTGINWPTVTNANSGGYISAANPYNATDPTNQVVFGSDQVVRVR